MEAGSISGRCHVRWFIGWTAVLLAALPHAGCSVLGSRSSWYPPADIDTAPAWAAVGSSVDLVETQYEAGQQAEAAGDARCIDFYLAAATQAWPYYAGRGSATDGRIAELYESSVRRFLESAVRLQRFSNTQGVRLASGAVVPVFYHGFAWQPCDFATLLPVGSYESPRLSRRYVSEGVGVPYVVLAPHPPRYPFAKGGWPFGATAVVSPTPAAGGGFALDFYDPLRTSATDAGLPLARDLTASIAYAASQRTDAWLDDFLRPDRGDALDGLYMCEPYQPGKIPIVFVHGLASDPLTWAELANDLQAQPAIFSRYQFWYFRYDTGDPFLSSAARLRRQLVELRQTYDPQRCNPLLSQMVLVGHSMGGLVSKMQVTYSGDELWRAAATRPFETTIADPATRADLAAAFFFAPSPDIKQVIYIATPHRGSGEAQRWVGRISSALVEDPPSRQMRFDQFVSNNPGIFRDELARRVPNSIDLLEPSSLILQATERLPYGAGVSTHSVIGDDRWQLGEGPSDGVVPVSSSRLAGVRSELVVDAQHTQVQRDPNTVREVSCILLQHAAAMGR